MDVTNRIQLAGCLLICSVASTATWAQSQDGAYRMAPNKDGIEIDFLGNYYSQDGDFGTVQGGLGTEELSNVAGVIVINVPVDSNSALNATVGADFYSSASTDRIDYQLSTASSQDLRGYVNLGWTERRLSKGRTYTAKIGTSQEYDYQSYNAAIGVAQEWNRGVNELSIGLQGFFDRWSIIYPTEFDFDNTFDRIPDRGRQSLGLSISYARILNPRTQFAINAEIIAMRGLLSTPFHRIYFQGTDPIAFANGDRRDFPADDIERLPNNRTKFPVSLRVNHKLNDVLTVRTFARYYLDSWAVQGATADLELAYSIGEAWTIMPYARYHTQQASQYYAGFAEHTPDEQFYTSDIDLATFNTTKVGLGVRYAPTFGLARAKLGRIGLAWKQISVRGSYYQRSVAFNAYSFSLATGLTILNRKP